MDRNYEIVDGIYLKLEGSAFDLHNNFDFEGLNYSIIERKLILFWNRSKGDWVDLDTPSKLVIEFTEVSEFRFMPRDTEVPFTEDDCINTIGYWTDEEWADGVVVLNADQKPEPGWLIALDFMSGAVLAVQATNSQATVS